MGKLPTLIIKGCFMRKLFCWTIIFLMVTQPAWATTYNIGPGQTYETFTALVATETLAPGDVVDGGGNTFAETWTPDGSGTGGNVITLRNAYINASGKNYGVDLLNRSYITVSGITSIGSTLDNFFIAAHGASIAGITIEDCVSNTAGRYGFYVSGASPHTISSINFIRDTANNSDVHGFHVWTNSASPVTYSEDAINYYDCVSDSSGQDLSVGSHGFSSISAKNITYTRCVAKNTRQTGEGSEGNGFQSDDYSSNITFSFVESFDNDGCGVVVSHQDLNGVGEYNTIENSVIYGNADCGIYSNGTSGGSANVSILSNSLYNNGGQAIQVVQPADNITIKNNITHTHTYGLWASAAGITNLTALNNLTFNNSVAHTLNITNSNGITTDPLFVSTTDFRLKQNSPARKAGTGTKHNVLPADIGAYQTSEGFFGTSFFYSPGYPLGSTKNVVTTP